MYTLYYDHAHLRIPICYGFGDSKGAPVDSCEQQWFDQATRIVPTLAEPRSVGLRERQRHFVAHVAIVGAYGLVERVRVDLVDGNAIAVDPIINCR